MLKIYKPGIIFMNCWAVNSGKCMTSSISNVGYSSFNHCLLLNLQPYGRKLRVYQTWSESWMHSKRTIQRLSCKVSNLESDIKVIWVWFEKFYLFLLSTKKKNNNYKILIWVIHEWKKKSCLWLQCKCSHICTLLMFFLYFYVKNEQIKPVESKNVCVYV